VNAPFVARNLHSSIVFDSKLWIIGGSSDSGWRNDIWYTSDGINWTEVDDVVAFAEMNSHSTVAFDDKIWVIAGNSSELGVNNKVWAFE